MAKYILALTSILLICGCQRQPFDKTYGAPVIVLMETNPWLIVIGSDVPSFALYKNGQIIYKKITGNEIHYYEVVLSQEKARQVIESFGITDSLLKRKTEIIASTGTDQPENILLLDIDHPVQISVYGYLPGDSEARRRKPGDFLTVFDRITGFSSDTAHDWLPDFVEVLAAKSENTAVKPMEWNKEWGGIHSATTVKRNGDLYSIYLDKRYFPAFLQLRRNLKVGQPVLIDGGTYSLYYRFPFPNIR